MPENENLGIRIKRKFIYPDREVYKIDGSDIIREITYKKVEYSSENSYEEISIALYDYSSEKRDNLSINDVDYENEKEIVEIRKIMGKMSQRERRSILESEVLSPESRSLLKRALEYIFSRH